MRRNRFVIRGVYYHHLRLGIRIFFEPTLGGYAVTCNGRLIGRSADNSSANADRIFAGLARQDSLERRWRSVEERFRAAGAAVLRCAIEESGLSIRGFAKAIGQNRETMLTKVLNGKLPISPNLLERLVEYVGGDTSAREEAARQTSWSE